jgi:mRNA interferase MazF
MVNPKYIPDRGDIVWVTFSPTIGHEQSGKRPGLILSSREFNKKTNLAFIVPISSKEQSYKTEIIWRGKKITGTILAYKIKTIDWKSRKVEFSERIDQDTLTKVQSIVISIIISK